eukprot:RCo038898
MGFLARGVRQLRFITTYSHADLQKRPSASTVGLTTVIILVFLSSFLLNGMAKVPATFVRLAEKDQGEMDLLLTAGSGHTTKPYLNFTEVEERLRGVPEVLGCSPRWLLPAMVSNPESPELQAEVLVLLVDTEREQRIGIGRAWPFRPLNQGEMHARDSIFRSLRLRPESGDRATLHFNFSRVLLAQGMVANGNFSQLAAAFFAQLLGQDLDAPITVNVLSILEGFGLVPNFTITVTEEAIRNFLNITAPPDDMDSRLNSTLTNANLTQAIEDFLGSSGYVGTNPAEWAEALQAAIEASMGRNASEILRRLQNTNRTQGPITLDMNQAAVSLLNRPTTVTLGQLLGAPVQWAGGNSTARSLADVFATRMANFEMDYVLVGSVSIPNGKFPSALGNAVVIDSQQLLPTILSSLCTDSYLEILRGLTDGNVTTGRELRQRVSQQTRINEYAMSTIIMDRDRRDTYMLSTKPRTTEFIQFTNVVFEHLGLSYDAKATFPVMEDLVVADYLRMFLDQTIYCVVVMVVVLASLVVYSLLHTNSEAKVYEYGMLRALGLPNASLWTLLTYNALLFTLPAVGLGLLVAFVLSVGVELLLSW